MAPDDVFYLTIGELGALIKAGKLSPVDLTESYLRRSASVGSRLHAYVTLTRDLALRQAEDAAKEIKAGRYRGPLHGIPYAAKDLLAVKGYPTTWGARPYARQTFNDDATVINRLRESGAILIGKAAMVELAGGLGYRYASASITGATKNPWNENCWTCGSSSGSGAVASAGLAGFAIGSETWGSIICPSAFCGVSGLRPTYGRVSRHGAMALAFSMDKLGVLARSADDCGLVLAHIAGHDPFDPGSLSNGSFKYEPAAEGARRLRIGVVTNAWSNTAPEVDQAFRKALALLRTVGADIDEIKLPEGPWEAAANTVVSVEAAAAFEPLITSGRVSELTDPLGRIGGYVNAQVPATDYLEAIRIRGILQRRIDKEIEPFDVITAPSQPVPATTLDTNLEKDLSFPDPLGCIGNFCGLPAISVPCGFTTQGLPVGIQFVARPLGEVKAIAAARLFQQHTDWHKRQPIK